MANRKSPPPLLSSPSPVKPNQRPKTYKRMSPPITINSPIPPTQQTNRGSQRRGSLTLSDIAFLHATLRPGGESPSPPRKGIRRKQSLSRQKIQEISKTSSKKIRRNKK